MTKHIYLIFPLFFLLQFSFAQVKYFPSSKDWKSKTAKDFGIKTDELQKAVDFAKVNEYKGSKDLRIAILKGFAHEPYHQVLGKTRKRGGPAGVILKNGYIVAQWGDVNRVDMTFSVTKSYLSTICGLAIDEGLIPDVTNRVGEMVWDGTFDGAHNNTITWQHLLTQSSDWSGTLFGGKDWADRPPKTGDVDDWKMRTFNEPGTVMEYNDVRVNVLSYSLLQVWRKPLPVILKEKIMNPIGASPTWRWYGYENSFVNVDGIMMQSVSGGGHSGGGMFINTLDQARFGLLFLRKGNWNGKQLISKKWIDEIQVPSKANSNYGYMWWLNQKGKRHWEGVPEHLYYAAGFGGNFIVIDEKNDLVIVTRWLEPSKIGELVQLVLGAM